MASASPGKCATITAVDLTNPVKNIGFLKKSVNLIQWKPDLKFPTILMINNDGTLHNIILQLHCSVVLKKNIN